MIDTSSTILAGMTPVQLQAALASAQAAYISLSTGQQAVDVSYAQGDGMKRVIYQKTEIAALAQLIKLLQAQLGIVSRPRRPLRPYF